MRSVRKKDARDASRGREARGEADAETTAERWSRSRSLFEDSLIPRRAPLCTPATRAIPPHFAHARHEEERHGSGDRARGPAPHASRSRLRGRRAARQWRRSPINSKKRVPFFSATSSCGFADGPPSARRWALFCSQFFYPRSEDLRYAAGRFVFREGGSFRLPRVFRDCLRIRMRRGSPRDRREKELSRFRRVFNPSLNPEYSQSAWKKRR